MTQSKVPRYHRGALVYCGKVGMRQEHNDRMWVGRAGTEGGDSVRGR